MFGLGKGRQAKKGVENLLQTKVRDIMTRKVLSVAPLLGEAIKRIHMNESVSSLFV